MAQDHEHDAPEARPHEVLGSLEETLASPEPVPGSRPLAPELITAQLDRIGRYVVSKKLGEGGMGVVFEAFDPELNRRVAIKVLRRSKSAEEVQARLLREAQALAQLSHPAVIQIYDVGTVMGRIYIAVEFVDGETLSDWLSVQRPVRMILERFHQAGGGLAAAHEAGLVHRDFKPENVLIDKKGRVRVLDFGLAVSGDGHDPHGPGPALTDVSTSGSLSGALTRTGALMGTPAYMAPEQFLGGATSPRTDQFAFCVSLYQALYGERPFAGDSVHAISFAVCQGRIRPAPSGSRVPKRLRRVLLRGLSVSMDDRYPSMDALLRVLEPHWRPSNKSAWWIAAAGVGAVAVSLSIPNAPDSSSDPCADVSAVWDDAWNDDRKAQLRQNFDVEERPYLEALERRTLDRIDAYVAEGTDGRTAVCRGRGSAAAGTSLQEAQTRCFDRARRQTEVVIAELARADPETLLRSLEIVDTLPPLSVCGDLDAVRAAVAPPAPEKLETVHDLEGRLDATAVVLAAGRFDEARAALDRMGPRVDDLAYPPLSAALGHARAEVAAAEADWDQATQIAESAFHDAHAASDDPRAEAIAGDLAWWQAYGRSNYELARTWLGLARASSERLRSSALTNARLDAVEAHIATHQGRFAEAIALYGAAIDVVGPHPDAGPDELAELQRGLAYAHATHGDHDLSLTLSTAAHQTIVRMYGERHPTAATFLLRRAQAEQHARALDKATASREEALDILRGSLGARSSAVGKALFGLGNSATARGDHEATVRYIREALDIFVDVQGPRSRHAAAAHNNLGNALRRLGRHEEAAVHLRQAAELFEALFGKDAPNLAYAHYSLGQCARETEDLPGALEHLAEAWRIHQLRTIDPIEKGRVAHIYAEVLTEVGRTEEGRAIAADAVDILSGIDPTDPKALAAARRIAAGPPGR